MGSGNSEGSIGEFDRIDYLQKQKQYLEIRKNTFDKEIDEILPELDRSEQWEWRLRNQREQVASDLADVKSELSKELEDSGGKSKNER